MVRGNKKGMGPSLKTLDLSEWQGQDADLHRPNLKTKKPGYSEVTGEDGPRPPASSKRQDRGLGASLTSCSESVPDSFLSLPLFPIPPFFRLLPPGFRPLWEGIIHLLRGLPAPSPPPQPPPTPVALAFHAWTLGPNSPPAGTLVPVHVVVFPIPLHVRHRCHQVL